MSLSELVLGTASKVTENLKGFYSLVDKTYKYPTIELDQITKSATSLTVSQIISKFKGEHLQMDYG